MNELKKFIESQINTALASEAATPEPLSKLYDRAQIHAYETILNKIEELKK